MKELLNRLLVTDSETNEESVSESVEWRDISIETNGPTGWASTSSPEECGPADTESPFETLNADRLVGTVLDGVTVPTLVVDRAGEIVHINAAACESFETSRSAAIGTTPTAVHGGQRLLGQVLLAGEEISDRRETVTIGGSERPLRRTLKPLTDDRGEIVGAVETVHCSDSVDSDE